MKGKGVVKREGARPGGEKGGGVERGFEGSLLCWERWEGWGEKGRNMRGEDS